MRIFIYTLDPTQVVRRIWDKDFSVLVSFVVNRMVSVEDRFMHLDTGIYNDGARLLIITEIIKSKH